MSAPRARPTLERLEPIHNRMPVILDEAGAADWMNLREPDPLSLKRLLAPAPDDLLVVRPASPLLACPPKSGAKMSESPSPGGDGRMRASRFSEEQIIGILREHEAGAKTPELCRRHGISDATFYKWKAKYGGLEVSEARRLKSLEDENRRLKKLLAEAMLDNAALKDILGKNG